MKKDSYVLGSVLKSSAVQIRLLKSPERTAECYLD